MICQALRVGPAVRGLIVICGGLFLATGWAQPELRPLPPLIPTLSDAAGALTDAEGFELSKSLQEVVEATSVRIIMIIVETTAPEPIEDYADRLARRWNRERAIDPTRSIFVIVAVNDREMQVLPGRALGLDAELTGAEIARGLVPLFRERRYFEALMRLTARLRGILEHRRPQADRQT